MTDKSTKVLRKTVNKTLSLDRAQLEVLQEFHRLSGIPIARQVRDALASYITVEVASLTRALKKH